MKQFMAQCTEIVSLVLLLLMVVAMETVQAEDDVIRLQGISIQGNAEEPRVLYITPWQPPPGTGRLYQPVYSYRDHWMQPLDRSSLRREMYYAERFLPKKVNQDRLKVLLEKLGQTEAEKEQ